MTSQELYNIVTKDLPNNLHPLHKAIMEECCENAINNSQKLGDKDTLIYAVRVAFLTCDSTLKGALQYSDADGITLNYRGQTFIIEKDSGLLT